MEDQRYAEAVKATFNNCLHDLTKIKQLYLRNPETDFTRERKLSFEALTRSILMMGDGSLQNELLKYFSFSDDTLTKSAFCQQRAKVLPDAFQFMFAAFTEKLDALDKLKLFHGYRLLAADGSDINIPYNPNDTETFHQNGKKKGYNQLHLNALFDPLNGTYSDCVLEPDRKSHERAAFITMVDRYRSSTPSIFIADRGYEGYQTFAHLIRSGQKFLVRLKDPDSNGILSTHQFPAGEFDNLTLKTILTHRQTKDVLANKDKYTIIPDATKCDFLTSDEPFFPLSLRIVCVEVADGDFEYLATNLDPDEFPLDLIKDLYHMRWGIETSFRELKYTIDILHFHARKREFVEQEAWCKLILYNFCEAITRHTAISHCDNPRRKHDQIINFSTAACICKEFLKRIDGTFNVCRSIRRFLSPIRPNRSAPRNLKPQSAKPFLYRTA